MGFFGKLFGHSTPQEEAWRDLERQQEQTAMDMVNAAVAEHQLHEGGEVKNWKRPEIAEAVDMAYRAAAENINKAAADKDWERSCLNIGEAIILLQQNLICVARKCGLGLGATALAVVEAFSYAKFTRVDRLYRGVIRPPVEHADFIVRWTQVLRPRFADAYQAELAKISDRDLATRLVALSDTEALVLQMMLQACEAELEFDAAVVAVFGLSTEIKRELCREVYGV